MRKAKKKQKGGWEHVYAAIKQIPRGRVMTYGQLARILRLPGGARTLGYAMAGCPSGRGIPWHRVVGAGGRILPREPYGSKQRRLLETEGTKFSGMAVDMAAHHWKPKKFLAKSAPRARTK
ncbi:MAG TPA: MGMT family protein [Candidatus Acidoferrales bacterium]|nr:MGMT family protein [Candidatus Acidoferrales bacterium]